MNLTAKEITFSIREKILLKGFSFSFQKGKLYLITGPNGSGKTTLLKILAGLLPPTNGKVLLDASPLSTLKRYEISQKITYMPQSPTLAFPFTTSHFVLMGGYARKSFDEKRLFKCLQQTDTSHLANIPVNKLSQGERQRVYLARALYTQAPYLLLDEPTASLDHIHKTHVWNLLSSLANEEQTFIVVTHDLTSCQAEILAL